MDAQTAPPSGSADEPPTDAAPAHIPGQPLDKSLPSLPYPPSSNSRPTLQPPILGGNQTEGISSGGSSSYSTAKEGLSSLPLLDNVTRQAAYSVGGTKGDFEGGGHHGMPSIPLEREPVFITKLEMGRAGAGAGGKEGKDNVEGEGEGKGQGQGQGQGQGEEFVEKTRDFGFLPIPRHLRFHPDRPFHFGLGLNVAFGFASTFIVSNLYYNQPLLIQLSHTFGVPYTRVSSIPTLTQAGYATGLLFISPLGDLVPRRPLILLTISLSTLLTIGLCVARDVRVFEGISYAVGVCTVTPQILIPLAADLAPPERRASAISVVLSGLLFGILIARVLSGVIAEFTSWRVVYYFAVSVQSLVLLGAYLLLPAYPAKNTEVGEDRMTYGKILKSMARYAVTEPLLVQCTLVNLCSAAAFANFWVTLTFLLGGPPYHYSTLVIGLFGLVGMAGVAFGPVVGYVIDRLVPWYASLTAVLGYLVFQSIQTAAGTRSVAVVVVVCFGLDVFRQMLQVSLTTAAFGISTAARARLNAILILGIFIGQVTGTALGTHLFLTYGFLPNAGLNLGLMGMQLLLLGIRGPGLGRYGWFGWAKTREGWEWRRAKAQNVLNGKDGGAAPPHPAEPKEGASPSPTREDSRGPQNQDASPPIRETLREDLESYVMVTEEDTRRGRSLERPVGLGLRNGDDGGESDFDRYIHQSQLSTPIPDTTLHRCPGSGTAGLSFGEFEELRVCDTSGDGGSVRVNGGRKKRSKRERKEEFEARWRMYNVLVARS